MAARSSASLMSTPKKKKSAIVKGLLIICGIVLFVVLGLGLLLTWFFPSEFVRKELEVRGSELLQGTVRVQTLRFNLLTGLELENVDVELVGRPLLQLKRMNLDYSLLALLRQHLVVNEVSIDGADLALNLPELASRAEPIPELEEQPEPAVPAGIPPIPLDLELESLAITRSNVKVIVNPTLSASLRDINVEVAGGIAQQVANLKGALRVSDITMDMEGKRVRLPLESEFHVMADLGKQHLELETFALKSTPSVTLSLSGTVDQFLTAPILQLSVNQADIELDQVLKVGKDFIPPEVKPLTLGGVVSSKAVIRGKQSEKGFEGNGTLTVALRHVSANAEAFHVDLHDANGSITVKDLVLRDKAPESTSIQINLNTVAAGYQDYAVRDVNVGLSADYFALGPVSCTLTFSGTAKVPPLAPWGALNLPVALQLDALGNVRTEEVTIRDFILDAKDLVKVQVRGEVQPLDAATRLRKVSLSSRFEPATHNVLQLAPPQLLEGVHVSKPPGRDLITIDVSGTLNPDYLPHNVDLTSGVGVSQVGVGFASPAARGLMEQMTLSLKAAYRASPGTLKGSLSSSVALRDLDYAAMAKLAKATVTLGSTFSGKVSSDRAIRELVADNSVTMRSSDLRYTTPTMTATIPEILLSAKTMVDLGGQRYVLQDFHVTSDPILDVAGQGEYSMKDQHFRAAVTVPTLNVGALLQQVSGSAVKAVEGLKPKGTLSVSMEAAGKIPQQADIDQFNIPVHLTTRVNLKDVSAAAAGYRLEGAGGTISLIYEPAPRSMAGLSTDLSVADVHLPEGLPLEHLTDAFAAVELSIGEFNELRLDPVRLGARGAEVRLKGTIAGFRPYLTGKRELGTLLEKLFAQFAVDSSVTLDEFPDVLRKVGLSGTGKGLVTLNVFKKERGPMDLQLFLGGQQLSVSQESLMVQKLDGGIAVRKTWDWQADGPTSRRGQTFRPTDVLAQVQSNVGKRQQFRIEKIDLGFLDIRNLGANMGFTGDSFKVQNLAMSLLGGGIGGNVVVKTGKAFGIAGRFEIARLDLNQLLPEEQRVRGDSQVDATVGLSVYFDKENGALDVSRTELNLFVTHIGREALDRVLVFLDPQGSNPTMVGARSHIKLANPSQVTIQLTRGLMGVEIRFSEGLLPSLKIDRIPVGKIRMFHDVAKGVPHWDMIRNVMELAGSQTYSVKQDGTLVFQ